MDDGWVTGGIGAVVGIVIVKVSDFILRWQSQRYAEKRQSDNEAIEQLKTLITQSQLQVKQLQEKSTHDQVGYRAMRDELIWLQADRTTWHRLAERKHKKLIVAGIDVDELPEFIAHLADDALSVESEFFARTQQHNALLIDREKSDVLAKSIAETRKAVEEASKKEKP